MLSMALQSPLDMITSFIVHAISRRFEFQADKFAFDLSNQEHHYADKLKSALVRLGDSNKSVTDVDELWSAYKHSHPVSGDREDRNRPAGVMKGSRRPSHPHLPTRR